MSRLIWPHFREKEEDVTGGVSAEAVNEKGPSTRALSVKYSIIVLGSRFYLLETVAGALAPGCGAMQVSRMNGGI